MACKVPFFELYPILRSGQKRIEKDSDPFQHTTYLGRAMLMIQDRGQWQTNVIINSIILGFQANCWTFCRGLAFHAVGRLLPLSPKQAIFKRKLYIAFQLKTFREQAAVLYPGSISFTPYCFTMNISERTCQVQIVSSTVTFLHVVSPRRSKMD